MKLFDKGSQEICEMQKQLDEKDARIKKLEEYISSLRSEQETYSRSINLARYENNKFNNNKETDRLSDTLQEEVRTKALKIRNDVIRQCHARASDGYGFIEFSYWGPFKDEHDYKIIHTIDKYRAYFNSYFEHQGIRIIYLMDPHWEDVSGIRLIWEEVSQ